MATFISWPLRAEAAPVSPARTVSPEADEVLMQRYQDGDDEAFRSLYARHRSSLLRFARHLCGHGAEAEEIFQETWIAVVKARSRYREESRFTTWLFSIAHRRSADAKRRRARRPADTGLEADQHTAPAADPPQQLVEHQRDISLRRAIARLPFEQREVFLLRAEAGLGLRDIARITHARPEATKSRLRYALRALRTAMKDWS